MVKVNLEKVIRTEEEFNIHICDYGCGREAIKQFKNGRWCCSDHYTKCSNKRKEIGKTRIGKLAVKLVEIETDHLCDYGCGQSAKYYFKRVDKWCCSDHYTKCPKQKTMNNGFKNGHEFSEDTIIKISNSLVEYFVNNNHEFKGKTYEKIYGEERAQKIKQNLSDKITETLIEHPGRGHRGWYRGFWCDSSWELAFVIWCLDHNINIIRNTKKFKYIYKGDTHNYTPDFKLGYFYIEVKGWETDKDKAKFDYFTEPLIILRGREIKPILDYVV